MERPDFFTLKNGDKVKLPFSNKEYDQRISKLRSVMEKNNLDKYTGILFELKIGLNKDNAIVIDYGGKPVGKVREALKGYPYHGNLCAAVINHANAVGRKLQDDIKQLIQKV